MVTCVSSLFALESKDITKRKEWYPSHPCMDSKHDIMFCCAAGGRKQSQSDQCMMDVRPTNPRIQPWSVSSPKAITSFILSAVFLLYCICLDMSVCLSSLFVCLSFVLATPSDGLFPLFLPLSWSPVYGVEFLCWYYWVHIKAFVGRTATVFTLWSSVLAWFLMIVTIFSHVITERKYKTNAWVQTADRCHNRYNFNT